MLHQIKVKPSINLLVQRISVRTRNTLIIVLQNINGITEIFTRDTGKTMKDLDKGNIFGQVVKSILENLRMTLGMAKV